VTDLLHNGQREKWSGARLRRDRLGGARHESTIA
jgi:hypothetical protein